MQIGCQCEDAHIPTFQLNHQIREVCNNW